MRRVLGSSLRATAHRGVLLAGAVAAAMTLAAVAAIDLAAGAAVTPLGRIGIWIAGVPVIAAASVPALVSIFAWTHSRSIAARDSDGADGSSGSSGPANRDREGTASDATVPPSSRPEGPDAEVPVSQSSDPEAFVPESSDSEGSVPESSDEVASDRESADPERAVPRPATHDDTGTGASTRRRVESPGTVTRLARETGRLLRTRGGALAAGTVLWCLAVLVLGVAFALVLHAIVFSLLTAVSFVAYAVRPEALISPPVVFRLSGLLLGGGFVLSIFATRYFDCFICGTDAGPVRSIRASLRFASAAPGTFASYVVVSWLVLGLAGAIAALADAMVDASLVAGLVGFSGLAVALAFFGAFHATVFHRRVVPVVCGSETEASETMGVRSDSGPRSYRNRYRVPQRPLVSNVAVLVVVVLLVTGLLVGSASIRAFDVRPTPEASEPGPIDEPVDPATALTAEAIPVESASHAVTQQSSAYNESTGTWGDPVTFRFGQDLEDRRMTAQLLLVEPDGELDLDTQAYFSSKEFAMKYRSEDTDGPVSEPPEELAWYQAAAGNWTVYSVAGYFLVEGDGTVSVDDAFLEQDWAVDETSSETVTLRAEGADVVPMDGTTDPLEPESTIEVTLDRETGYVLKIVEELHFAADGQDVDRPPRRTVTEFEEWGTHEVERPDEFGPVRPLEWAWGIAYY